ncbi:uncharacterized protein LOC120490748 [Pimephales promelas]|uniref:uncharacterized protein LOC120490748 n=1 Tax=Pimephales promelas TaxID=90988 RepID=UPI001955E574|nr:uncharacterized protein LOC120490748 [Pimephales promelas]
MEKPVSNNSWSGWDIKRSWDESHMKAMHRSNTEDLYSFCSLLQTTERHQKQQGSTVTDANVLELALFIFNSDGSAHNQLTSDKQNVTNQKNSGPGELQHSPDSSYNLPASCLSQSSISRQWGQIRVNPLFQTPCGCPPPRCHQSQLDGQSRPLSFIITHEHTCSQVQDPVRGAGAGVGKPPLFRDDKHLCKPSKQLLSFSLSLSKLTPTARTAVCLTPPKTCIQPSMRDKSKREIHHCRKSELIKALHASSKYNHCLGRRVSSSPPLFT